MMGRSLYESCGKKKKKKKNCIFHRVIRLTKLPRKIVQGGEPMQVNFMLERVK